jgi:CheY-like chemotaxis protein
VTDFDDVDILLVEDNRHDAELAMRAFKRGQFNNKLLWVRDGVEALEFFHCSGDYEQRNPLQFPKLVLLDLKMPRLNGMDVLRALKSDVRTQRVPIVVLSSSNQPRDVTETYRLGGNGYVTKPIQFADLMGAIEKIGTYWLQTNQLP